MRKMESKTTDVEKAEELQELNKELNASLSKERAALSESEGQKGKSKSSGKHIGRKARRSRMSKGKKLVRGLLITLGVFLFLIAAACGGFYILQWRGKASLTSHEKVEEVVISVPEVIEEEVEVEIEEEVHTITYNGKKYRRNEDIISILCMGIDQEEFQGEESEIGENGQADALFVVTLDTVTGSIKILNISRDAMVDVDLYNIHNEYVETSKMQLCLAYAYGDGKETSCENTMKSVSRLLYGMPIDAYAAIDLQAIDVLNDAVGGVEVVVLENLGHSDPIFVEGERILLKGEQAETYVRSRFVWTLESNNSRMARQKQYLTNFIAKALEATKEDITVPLTLYREAGTYMVTDIKASQVTYLASLILKGGFNAQDIISIPGEVKKGDPYAEFYVDEKALYEIILDVYYTEV